MFKCIDCKTTGTEFDAEPVDISRGALMYRARCPKCKSRHVIIEPGTKEKQIRLKLTR